MATLLDEILTFCAAHGMAESTFGERALNDKPFVSQLKSGRRVWPETEIKVRKFIAGYRPDAEQDAA
jgi:hypothetical protein